MPITLAIARITSNEIAKRIEAAREEGDLKENGGYHAAREEQGKQEARIRELKAKLANVHIGTPADDGVVEPGMLVTATVAALAGLPLEQMPGGKDYVARYKKRFGEDVQTYSPYAYDGAMAMFAAMKMPMCWC